VKTFEVVLIIYTSHKFMCKNETRVLTNGTALFTQTLQLYAICKISSITGIHKFNNLG